MRHLDRLPEPAILQRKRAQWLKRFLESERQRPDSRQYGHAEIHQALAAMSYHKCFYCECKVDAGDDEVDHYIEVAESPEKAFDWDNLYLSCCDCNRKKLSNTSIPVGACIDPCGPDDPADHLTFEGEIITAKDGSPKGLRTIQKYSLDRPMLNHQRVKALQRFDKTLRQLHERRGARPLNEEEKEVARRFAQPDHPFSFMFQVYLGQVLL
jgi:uncharacterized protein (TIGR02646 family)